ncbi:MAG TPA: hypothetical protein VKX17_27860 [Planctomycetota bacterium]|nr:hypothetical protein [Planctomycetota bacterium]
MKLIPRIFSAIAITILACAARAESDYEYAKMLIQDINSASFSTDDLVERMAARLAESPNPQTKLESKLIQATLLRRQAADAPADKRVEKLKQANVIYKDIVSLPADEKKKFRLIGIAEKDAEAIESDILRAGRLAAKGNPELEKKLSAEAGAIFEKRAAQFKDAADKLEPEFKAAFDRFNKEKTRLNPPDGIGDHVPGREILEPLDRLFDAWITADQKYVAAKVEQVEALDESDANRKKVAEETIAHCQKQIDNEIIADWAAVSARYSYLQGRVYADIGNEDGASKAWNDVLEVELGQLPDYVKKSIIAIDKMIIADLVRMKMKNKKYSDVEDIFLSIRTKGILRGIFDEDIGKQLVVEYVRALTIPAETAAEYEKAVKELRDAIAKEPQANSMWANSFARAMAEILIDARSKRLNPHLNAREWYDAAHGMHLVGRYIYTQEYEKLAKSSDPADKEKAKAKFDEAYKEFANAVDYYRRAISEARRPDHTDLATRLDIEPKSWFEMGICYNRMKHDYEAIVTYKALRDTFLPENRTKWMTDTKKLPPGTAQAIKVALTTLDLPREKGGMLAASMQNIMVALESNEKVHKDPWNVNLRAKILGLLTVSPLDPKDSLNDSVYTIADGDLKLARSLADAAKKEQSNPAVAMDNWNQAFNKYLSAADKFTKVSASSPAYEYALVNYANSLTQAQAILGEGRVTSKDPKVQDDFNAQSKDLVTKSLAGYQKFEDFVDKNPSNDEKTLTRRKAVQGVILLAKNSLYVGAGEWKKAVETSDQYIAWESENPQQTSAANIAYLNKFRALIAQAAVPAPQSDPFLKEALVTLRDLRKVKQDSRTDLFLLKVLSDRFASAAYQLDKKRKEGGSQLSKEEIEKLEEQVREYEVTVAKLEGERIGLAEEARNDLGLDDYSRLVYLQNLAGETKDAADSAVKLLKKFDPTNKNQRIPDDEKIWKQILAEMLPSISYSSITKNDRCIAEHRVLVDLMYDTDAGATRPEGDPQRPPNDLYNQNMEKALAKLESIKNKDGEFKDVATLRVGPKPDGEAYKSLVAAGIDPAGKSWLAIIEEEIQYRRKVEAARDLLADLALEVARKLGIDAGGDEYMKIAKEQIEILKARKGESTAIEIKVAEIDIALGKVEDALQRLFNILPNLDPSSERYFYVKRRISEIYFDQKKWKDAAEYPEFVAVTQGFNSDLVKKRWPNMKSFLKSCYDNGAVMPSTLKKKFETDTQPDATKTDAAKPDATKPEAPKPDEKKAPEAK